MKNTKFYKNIKLALLDIKEAFGLSSAWLWLSWNDIKQRYRRSILGPFWITLSLGITVFFMGILYSNIFKINIHDYMPYLTSGLVSWTLISTMILEGSTVFINNEAIIKQVYLPYSFHIFRMLSRNIIIWFHNLLVLILVKIYFWLPIDFNILWIILSAFVVCSFSFGFSLILGLLCARYRDLQQIIISMVQLLFFVTPVLWTGATLGEHAWVLEFNIFYYYLDILRQPFNCHNIWQAGFVLFPIAISIITLIIGIIVFAKYRNRIAYWI